MRYLPLVTEARRDKQLTQTRLNERDQSVLRFLDSFYKSFVTETHTQLLLLKYI